MTERKDHNTCTRLENELTRTNQLLNSLYTEFAVTKELFRKDTVLTKQSLAALTIQHIETEKRIGALTDDHSATKQTLKRTQTELDHTTEELANVKRELEHEKERHRQSRIIPPTETTGIHQIVEFPKTITNEGNAWDSRTSTFKSPRAGLYYFSASIMSHQGEDIETELVRNGIGLIYSYDGDKGTLGVGSLSGVLKLNPGDDVWIRIYNNPNVNDVTTSKPVPQSVAFFAVMTDHQQHLGIHQTVGFQRAVTNVGNGWDGQANVFRAPKAGLYYFSATIMSHYAEDIETELVMKGVPIVYSYDGDKATHGVGTLSAVLNLSVGDDVWIRIHNNPVKNDGNVRVYGGAWSWFSGFLISE
ncbi:C1QL [Mytilus edulis]|uniref:C1QL n=1 Tax=Mytilus edulis TaxID=6550 RepID=A0A8S3U035_MYTED|nr:C1QL [Mytilus edulis]